MLQEKQKKFVEELLLRRCKNQTEAAIAAGYSPKTASSQSSQLLKNPNIRAYLEERKKEIASEIRQEFIFDALEARKVMHDIMVDPLAENRDKLNAAKDFLDRAGFKAPDKVDHTADIKNNLFEAIKDSAKEAGNCITIDSAESN